MAIVRIQHNKENPYVTLNKKALEDRHLSWGARGLWSYLMSRPDDWTISVSHLKTLYSGKGGGEKAIYSLLNQLIEEGYCTRIVVKNEKGLFGKPEYIITEFKKKVPHSLQRDVGERRPGKGGTTKYIDILSKEEKEEQQQSKITKEEKPMEKKPAGGCVVFYKCIEEIGLSEKEKKSLMKHSEQEVKDAVDFVCQEEFKVKTTLIQALKWAIKEKPALANPVDLEKNIKLAKTGEIILESLGWKMEASVNGVIINCKSPNNPTEHHVPYKMPNFKTELDRLLKKYQFFKGQNANASGICTKAHSLGFV